MNLSESMKFVLKNRSGELLSSFWKSDLKLVFGHVKKDISVAVKSGVGKLSSLKQQSLKQTMVEAKETTLDTVTVFKEVPSRIRQAFVYFQQDLVNEMDALPDQKLKTLFCLKVIGVLSSFTLKTLYGVRRSTTNLQFRGLNLRGAFAQVIATELLVRIIQVFSIRLINEIEMQMDDQEELKKLSTFKAMLSTMNLSELKPGADSELEKSDKAFAVVESFKIFILTGKRVQP